MYLYRKLYLLIGYRSTSEINLWQWIPSCISYMVSCKFIGPECLSSHFQNPQNVNLLFCSVLFFGDMNSEKIFFIQESLHLLVLSSYYVESLQTCIQHENVGAKMKIPGRDGNSVLILLADVTPLQFSKGFFRSRSQVNMVGRHLQTMAFGPKTKNNVHHQSSVLGWAKPALPRED